MRIKLNEFKEYLMETEKAKNTIEKYISDIYKMYEYISRCAEQSSEWFRNINKACRGELSAGAPSGVTSPSINKEIIIKYKEHLKIIYNKTSTINSKLSSINAYLKFIGKDEYKTSLIKKQKKYFSDVNDALSKEELNSLINACSKNIKNKLIIETIVRTGIRASELKYITYDSLIKNVAVVQNKGKVREVIIPRDLCEKIKANIGEINLNINKINLCNGELCEPEASSNETNVCSCDNVVSSCAPIVRSCELASSIFVTRNNKPIDRKTIWSILKQVSKKANVDIKKVYPHNLRHLFAREFYNKTKDIVKLSLILGHSSIETTKIYVRSSLQECRELVEGLEIVE